ncbi:MAG: hypothetical protein WBF17_16875 [Phycisphaerae bacterium]
MIGRPGLVALMIAAASVGGAQAAEHSYAVVASKATAEAAQWKGVIEVLLEKHDGKLVVYGESVAKSLAALRKQFPRHVCFVARPEEAGRSFVAQVHRLTRKLDDDPYTDAIWGILTGYDAANARRIAEVSEPLLVRRVAAGTNVELPLCEEGVWYCELVKNRMIRKNAGGEPRQLKGPDDTTKALVDSLNEYHAQLFVTSGHATERDWQIGYRYRTGQFRCKGGKLYGLDTKRQRHPIRSGNPKVYLAVGNCLMGHIRDGESMALAWMNSAGVCQMVGYTVSTWYGYGGWGMLDYFLEQPGRFTLAEAFFANHQALLHRLGTYFPEAAAGDSASARRTTVKLSQQARDAGLSAHDARGLLFDRDQVAFYGDPAWSAKMAPAGLAWQQKLTVTGGVYTFEITPNRGEKTFEPINTNGSQRGGRPIVELLPHRVRDVRIVAGGALRPAVADNFILVPNPRKCDPKRTYRVVFKAARID